MKRPEAAIVDGIIYLRHRGEKAAEAFLRVLKMRGTARPVEHALYISERGSDLPAFEPAGLQQTGVPRGKRQSTGIPGLDAMLRGGIPEGTTTLVSGATGTGKTLLALSWLVQGCREGQAGLLLSLDENAGRLLENARAFGWDLEPFMDWGLLQFSHQSPVDLDLDRLVYTIRAKMMDRVKRVVIDSISTYELGMADKERYTDYIWNLVGLFKASGSSLLLTSETRNLFSFPQVSQYGISYMADNIIYLQYQIENLASKRLIGVLKMRGSDHAKELREFVIGETGPAVPGSGV